MEKYELKIVMNGNTKNGINPANTTIYLNDEPVGCVQLLTIGMNINSSHTHIGFTMPDLRSPNVDPTYYTKPEFWDFSAEVERTTTLLKQCPNVSVSTMDLKDVSCRIDNEVAELREIGTNDIIDRVRLKTNVI